MEPNPYESPQCAQQADDKTPSSCVGWLWSAVVMLACGSLIAAFTAAANFVVIFMVYGRR
jgi:hypothetical protein